MHAELRGEPETAASRWLLMMLALILLGTIRNGMGLANIGGPTQTVVLGALLVAGVLRPVIASALARLARRPQRA